MANITKTDRKVVDGLSWCDFTVYDDGKIQVKSPFWDHVFFKPTKSISGKLIKNPRNIWLNETHLLHAPDVPLTKALNSL